MTSPDPRSLVLHERAGLEAALVRMLRDDPATRERVAELIDDKTLVELTRGWISSHYVDTGTGAGWQPLTYPRGALGDVDQASAEPGAPPEGSGP